MPSKWREKAKATKSTYESKWRNKVAKEEPTPELQYSEPDFAGGSGFVETLSQDPEVVGMMDTGKEFAGNIPGSAVNYGKAVLSPILHPKQTAKAMTDLALGVIEKFPGGRYLTPGPEYDIAGKENDRTQAINAVVDYYKETYGSIEGFKEAFKNDPVGVVADLAGVLVGSGGVVSGVGKATGLTKLQQAGEVIAKTGGYVEPLNIATTPVRAIKKLIPEGTAPKFYESAAKFPSSKTDIKSLVGTALEHQIMPTFTGLAKLGGKLDDLNSQIARMIDAAVDTGEKIKISRLLKGFKELSSESRLRFKALDARKTIKNIKKQLIETNSTLLEDGTRILHPLTAKEAQVLKQNIYQEFESYYARANADPIAARTAKLLARNAKEGIEKLIPEIKQLNKNDGDLIALRKVIDKVAPRISRRDFLSFGTTVKATAGGAIWGPTGMIAGLTLGILDSQPIVKARTALLIHKMREKGIKVRMTPAVVRILSHEAGELAEEISEDQ